MAQNTLTEAQKTASLHHVGPALTLEGYKGIEVEDINAEVTDQMIDDEIEKTRNMNARLVSVTRPVQNEDTVTIDYKGFVGDHQFEGGTAENQELVIGSDKFIPGFEAQLIGASIGDHVHVNVTFPEVYHSEELAGKDATFHVSVNDIKFKELPVIDDEFAKDVSEFDTLEAYKSNMKAELEVSAVESAKAARRDRVIDKVSELITVEIPAKMIESEIDGMLKEFDHQLQQQGLSLDQYVQFTGGSSDALREQMRADALARVKTSLVIEKVMVQENIEVSDADVDAEIEKIAVMQKRDAGEIRKLFEKDNYDYLKSNLKSRKTVDFLVDNAKFI